VNVHLLKYGADLVIGNILGEHVSRVYFCQRGVEKLKLELGEEDRRNGVGIEREMISEIARRHVAWMEGQK
jgi:hypothetical protein